MFRPACWMAALVLSASAAVADPRTDCFSKSGNDAIAACTRAIEQNPRDAVSYVNRAYEYFEAGQYTRSVADYTKAIELEPGRADALQGRAWAYLKIGKADLALADIERSLELTPDDARAHDARGHINEALGRKQDAIRDYRRALKTEPRMKGSVDGLKRLGETP